ncbi:ribonuclease H-like domain-containing protein [Tanacetum coccineum]
MTSKVNSGHARSGAELIDHSKLMKLMQFLMGLDDIYYPIRSTLLTREILPEVKDAFVIMVKEESQRGIPPTSAKCDKPWASIFVSRTNDNRKNNGNGNWNNGSMNNGSGNKGNYNSLLCKNCGLKGHTIERCFEIIDYPPGFKRNPNLKLASNFNNNMNNNVDTRGIFVGNNEIKTSTGTLSFTNEQVLKLMNLLIDKSGSTAHANMAVVPEYCVSLLSVHKLIKDSKLSVCFDESKCYIQDLIKERVLGTRDWLGHPVNQVLKLFKKSLNLSNIDHNSPCDVCHKAKQTKEAFPLSDHKSVWVYLHKTKDEVYEMFVGFYKLVLTQFNKKVKEVRLLFLVLNGKSPFSLVDSKEPNLSYLTSFECLCFATVVKGSDKFSVRSEKCVLIGYASGKKAYKLFSLENRSVLYSRDVKFSEIVFPYKMSNIEPIKEFDEIYTLDFFDHFESEPTTKISLRPNDDEERPLGRDGRVHQLDGGAPTYHTGHDGEHSATLIVVLRRSQRSSKLPVKLNEFVLDDKVKYGLSSCEPSSYEEALKDVNCVNVINEEMHALYENKTWSMIDLPIDRKPIGCKWVFKIRYKSNGKIERYKERLVAKGFSQKEGIDYEETFSHVVKMSIVRCLINLAVQKDWKVYQLDVNNAFLYGDLKEEVYMLPHPGFFLNGITKVCKLEKSLYGLEQAPKQWNHKLSKALFEACFVQSKNDHSLFIKNKGSVSLYLLVYVNDLVMTGNDNDEIESFKGLFE